jgi:biotin carboxyl carrier protein
MKWQILVDGRPIEIDKGQLESARQVESGVFSLLVDGQSFEVRVLPGKQSASVEVQGRRFTVEVRDPRSPSRANKTAVGGERQNVAAPMPGKVIRVLVKKGDVVEPGQGLVVVEAMKMQNEMKASRACRVADVRVRDGDTVGAGETMVVLE